MKGVENMTCNCSEFQSSTAELQLLNKSILDIVTKLDEQTSMLNRAIFKSATHCGCIEIHATKQIYSPHKSLEENQKELETHIEGELCPKCQDKIVEEMGELLFYLASMCEALNLNLADVMAKKYEHLKTLGLYNLL
jgi:predicted house-cleaning noncanonical NTP pyrophosphatase (MazG superfamily)